MCALIRLLHSLHEEHRVPVLLQGGGTICIAVQHLLHQGVAALLQPTPQAVATAASQLVEAAQTMLHEHSRCAVPWGLVGHTSQLARCCYS